MEQDILQTKQEQLLWETYKSETARTSAGPCPNGTELAAFMEDTSREVEKDRIYTHLTKCDLCFTTVRQLRQILKEDGLDAAKKSVIAHVLPFHAKTVEQITGISRKVVAAAVLAATCYLGYSVGQSTSSDDDKSRDYLRTKITQEFYHSNDSNLMPIGLTGGGE